MQSFRKVKMEMTRAHGYGQYYILAHYRGKDIKVHTTEGWAWDWFEDDSDKEKHLEALRYCYRQIVQTYRDCY